MKNIILFIVFVIACDVIYATRHCIKTSKKDSALKLAKKAPEAIFSQIKVLSIDEKLKMEDGIRYNVTAQIVKIFAKRNGNLTKKMRIRIGSFGSSGNCFELKKKDLKKRKFWGFFEATSEKNFYQLSFNPSKKFKEAKKLIRDVICASCVPTLPKATIKEGPKLLLPNWKNQSLSLTCVTDKTKLKTKFKWLLDNRTLQDDGNHVTIVTSKTRSILRINGGNNLRDGQFSCHVTNYYGTDIASTDFQLSKDCVDECDSNYCLHESLCCQSGDERWCLCFGQYTGRRCQDIIPIIKSTDDPNELETYTSLWGAAGSTTAVLGVLVALLFLGLVFVILYHVTERGEKRRVDDDVITTTEQRKEEVLYQMTSSTPRVSLTSNRQRLNGTAKDRDVTAVDLSMTSSADSVMKKVNENDDVTNLPLLHRQHHTEDDPVMTSSLDRVSA